MAISRDDLTDDQYQVSCWTSLVDTELYNAGLSTNQTSYDTILVGLNRKINKTEVQKIIDDNFEGCAIVIEQCGDKVKIIVDG